MYSTIRLASLVLFSFFIYSCQSEAEKKWEETMKVHDEVMLKMQETGDMGAKINELVHRAQKADSNSVLFTHLSSLQSAYHQLELADEEMMDWMATIQKPQKNHNQDSIIQYLEDEQEAIVVVGHHMDEAIQNAESVLKSLEK